MPDRIRLIYRAVWLLLVGLLLTSFAAAVPLRYNSLMSLAKGENGALITGLDMSTETLVTARLSLDDLHTLETLGISHRFYAGYILFFEVLLALVCALVGIFIFWRRSDDFMALWVSLILVLLGTNGPWVVVPTLISFWSGGIWVSVVAGFLGMVSHVHLLFVSPDGRFVPRWTLHLGAGFTGGLLGLALFMVAVYQSWGWLRTMGPLFLAFPIWFGLLTLGVFFQVYRYRRVSGPVQRQQTKWVAVGLAGVALGFGLNALFLFAVTQQSGSARLMYNMLRPPLVDLFMLLLPLSLGFSILRYRLWDIDVIIRRTLIYGLLTTSLAVIYFAIVVLMQQIIQTVTGGRSPLVIVASTLITATLFSPLQRRIQSFIDRRFYRRKYNAEQTLADFSLLAREQVDLDELTAALQRTVQDTVQPERLTLWLKER